MDFFFFGGGGGGGHMFAVFRAGKSIFHFRPTFNFLQLILKSLISLNSSVARERTKGL